ncbi:hypothetical protein SADUNF_Sadunf16G0173000 [Salix dunnii]|uniref:Histone H2A n=1 Tax=Salix dunnii TaxID=1413687 RepID=A0A835MM19_9ROSI|nr:hypothetical protein SADUNF_Sadunf16G0173000 [Salix dunnii]
MVLKAPASIEYFLHTYVLYSFYVYGQYCIKGKYAECLGAGAPVYLSIVLEYLATEILELVRNAARDNKKNRGMREHCGCFFTMHCNSHSVAALGDWHGESFVESSGRNGEIRRVKKNSHRGKMEVEGNTRVVELKELINGGLASLVDYY